MGEQTVELQLGPTRVRHAHLDADTIFVFSHPSASYRDAFLTEALVWHGAGVVGIDHRYVGARSTELDFREAAEDVAHAVAEVIPPGKRVVLVGHSGGAPLAALVQVRFRLADELILLAPHPSRAALLEAWIDPALRVDGTRDPDLDLWAEDRALPLDREFLTHYRAAQLTRIQRLAEAAAAHLRAGQGDAKLSIPGQCADPRFLDRSLDPNQRGKRFPLGDPRALNASSGFMADGVTARSFFDQWYRPTTPADLVRLTPYLSVPILSVAFGADALIFPSQTLELATALPPGSTVWTLDGAEHDPRDQPDHLDALARKMLAWLAHP